MKFSPVPLDSALNLALKRVTMALISLLAAVKRLMREAIELKDPTPMYFAQPLEENLFEWHFTILGPSGTDFEGGLYHGRIILPTEYPMKPPSIILLTVRHYHCI